MHIGFRWTAMLGVMLVSTASAVSPAAASDTSDWAISSAYSFGQYDYSVRSTTSTAGRVMRLTLRLPGLVRPLSYRAAVSASQASPAFPASSGAVPAQGTALVIRGDVAVLDYAFADREQAEVAHVEITDGTGAVWTSSHPLTGASKAGPLPVLTRGGIDDGCCIAGRTYQLAGFMDARSIPVGATVYAAQADRSGGDTFVRVAGSGKVSPDGTWRMQASFVTAGNLVLFFCSTGVGEPCADYPFSGSGNLLQSMSTRWQPIIHTPTTTLAGATSRIAVSVPGATGAMRNVRTTLQWYRSGRWVTAATAASDVRGVATFTVTLPRTRGRLPLRAIAAETLRYPVATGVRETRAKMPLLTDSGQGTRTINVS